MQTNVPEELSCFHLLIIDCPSRSRNSRIPSSKQIRPWFLLWLCTFLALYPTINLLILTTNFYNVQSNVAKWLKAKKKLEIILTANMQQLTPKASPICMPIYCISYLSNKLLISDPTHKRHIYSTKACENATAYRHWVCVVVAQRMRRIVQTLKHQTLLSSGVVYEPPIRVWANPQNQQDLRDVKKKAYLRDFCVPNQGLLNPLNTRAGNELPQLHTAPDPTTLPSSKLLLSAKWHRLCTVAVAQWFMIEVEYNIHS